MRSALRLLALLVAGLPALVLAGPSTAAQPPSPNDPCVSGGQDTCGTTGVGYYRVYRYGTRWFGDYRGVVPGTSHTFCIDLRFWYPSKTDASRELDTAAPRNRSSPTTTSPVCPNTFSRDTQFWLFPGAPNMPRRHLSCLHCLRAYR